MIKQYKPNNEIIITRIDNLDYLNNPNYVFVKCDIDDITIKCLISFIKSKYDKTEYYIINKTTDNSVVIKFLYKNVECREYINLQHMFLLNNILFIFNYSSDQDYSKFQLMKNRCLKINKLC